MLTLHLKKQTENSIFSCLQWLEKYFDVSMVSWILNHFLFFFPHLYVIFLNKIVIIIVSHKKADYPAITIKINVVTVVLPLESYRFKYRKKDSCSYMYILFGLYSPGRLLFVLREQHVKVKHVNIFSKQYTAG